METILKNYFMFLLEQKISGDSTWDYISKFAKDDHNIIVKNVLILKDILEEANKLELFYDEHTFEFNKGIPFFKMYLRKGQTYYMTVSDDPKHNPILMTVKAHILQQLKNRSSAEDKIYINWLDGGSVYHHDYFYTTHSFHPVIDVPSWQHNIELDGVMEYAKKDY